MDGNRYGAFTIISQIEMFLTNKNLRLFIRKQVTKKRSEEAADVREIE